MTRTRAVLVAVAVVAAFGATAGSLPASSPAPSTDSAGDPPTASSGGGGADGAVERPVTNPVSSETRARLLAALAAVGVGVAYVVVPAHRRTVALAAGVLAVAAASYAWLRPAAGRVLSAVAAATTAAAARPTGLPVAALVVLAAVALAWRRLRGDDGPHDGRRGVADGDESDDGAGDAAADVEGTATVDVHPATRPPSNDVVRAWQRAVERLSVPAPAARTPREFLDAARDDDATAVPDPIAFERLTATFERVRYGGVDPDEAAERARSLARQAVGDDRGDDATAGDDGGSGS